MGAVLYLLPDINFTANQGLRKSFNGVQSGDVSMKSVFVVFGSCGEYLSYQEWPVKAFLIAEAAQLCVSKCQKYADKVYGSPGSFDKLLASNPEDPRMAYDYTGTTYSMAEIEMGDNMTPEQVATDEAQGRRGIAFGHIETENKK